MENCWGELAINKDGKQCENRLKQCVTKEWNNLARNNIRKLNSPPKRMIRVRDVRFF